MLRMRFNQQRFSASDNRKNQRKAGAFAEFRMNLNIAAVLFYYLVCHGQPKSAAVGFCGKIRFKNFMQYIGGDAFSRVGDSNA